MLRAHGPPKASNTAMGGFSNSGSLLSRPGAANGHNLLTHHHVMSLSRFNLRLRAILVYAVRLRLSPDICFTRPGTRNLGIVAL
jgi:hypothetical protein